MIKNSFLTIAIALCSVCSFCQAQSGAVVFDKIVAVIGDNIVLLSDIENLKEDIKRRGGTLPESNPDCQLLEQEIVQKAMVIQAKLDSVVATDQEIQAEIDNRIRYFIQAYGGVEKLEEIAGKNVLQIKQSFIKPIGQSLSAQKFQNTLIDGVTITPAEVEKYHTSISSDSLPYYETEYEVGQIVRFIPYHPEVEEYTISQLNDFKRQIESGRKKIEILAKLYSDDPGSKDNGGYYEISKNDNQWDPVFFSTAFRLKKGEVSRVIKSAFGYHIIQLESRFLDDLSIRHILKIPGVREEEIEQTRKILDSVRQLLLNQKLPFSRAVKNFSEDKESKFNGGYFLSQTQNTLIPLDALTPDIAKIVSNMNQGDITEPMLFNDPQGRKAFRIIYLKKKILAHRENMELDYSKIYAELLSLKRQKRVEDWINTKLPDIYLRIDNDYMGCSQKIEEWVRVSKSKNVLR